MQSRNNNTKRLLKLINESLENDKAFDIKEINLIKRSSIADYMVLASGNSSRHVSSISKNLLNKIKKFGINPGRPEGITNSDWVLIDAYDIVIHLFRPEVREFYGLEKMWDMPNVHNKNLNKSK